MNRIFIEAKNKNTPEYHFLKTILGNFFQGKEVEFICMDGIGNLFNEANLRQISLAKDSGDQVIILADADTTAKGWGYEKRKEDIRKELLDNDIDVLFFLYPNNHDDGDVELLMEAAARRDLHSIVFDCFEDYEKCVSGPKDASGQPIYNTPDRKGKLHTYMTAQKLSNTKRKKLGGGDWLFNDKNYWNLDAQALQPLKDFFAKNLK